MTAFFAILFSSPFLSFSGFYNSLGNFQGDFADIVAASTHFLTLPFGFTPRQAFAQDRFRGGIKKGESGFLPDAHYI